MAGAYHQTDWQRCLLDKAKEAVEYFHRSTLGTDKMKNTQIQMGITGLHHKFYTLTVTHGRIFFS